MAGTFGLNVIYKFNFIFYVFLSFKYVECLKCVAPVGRTYGRMNANRQSCPPGRPKGIKRTKTTSIWVGRLELLLRLLARFSRGLTELGYTRRYGCCPGGGDLHLLGVRTPHRFCRCWRQRVSIVFLVEVLPWSLWRPRCLVSWYPGENL